MRRASPLLALVPLFFSARAALAADCAPASRVSTCVDADNLWLRAGSSQFLTIAGTTPTPARQISFGFLASYQKRPVVFRLPSSEPGGSDAYAIDDQVNGSLFWTLGLGKGLELTAVTPLTLYQNGVGTSPLTTQNNSDVVRSALRDARLGLSAALVQRPGGFVGQGLALGARAEVVFPTGDESVYAGGKGVGVAPSIVADYRVGRLLVGLEAGARVRPSVDVSGTTIGTQLYTALGASVDLLGERLSVSAEAFALPGFGAQKSLTRGDSGIVETGDRSASIPAEWLLALRSAPALAGDLSFHLGGGSSLPFTSNNVTSPAIRFVGGVRYAPAGRDLDGDGVLDRDDKCPGQLEDRDGFEDEDGCPDPDNDRDGIPDTSDRCRDAPEDRDGFEDDDGCPDPDDDGDGIPDADDRCRNKPEDKDNFQDDDGCPELDNDNDGIPDDKDTICPNGPEDMDGFKDEDGCPDPDNDNDGIPDADDKCPNEAEDKDGFQDEDGCPDPDNDSDGIVDAKDKCPNQPETIDGVDDDDGCPEPNAKDLVTLQGSRIELATPIRFAPDQAKITPEIERSLRMASQKARATPGFERLLVEVYADGQGPAPKQEALANRRAEAMRAVLLTAGLTNDNLTVAAGDLSAKRPARAPHADLQVLKKRPPKPPAKAPEPARSTP